MERQRLNAFIIGYVAFMICSVLCNFETEEPGYTKLLYGGVWKQVALNPSKKYTDVGIFERELLHYVKRSDFFQDHQIDKVQCHSMTPLLYSKSEREPLLFTKDLQTKDGFIHPYSFPIPLGITYNCEMNTTLKHSVLYQHYITATISDDKDDIPHVLSHVFYSSEYTHLNLKDLLHSAFEKNQSNYTSSSQVVLSTLSRTKELISNIPAVNIKLEKIKTSENYSFCNSNSRTKSSEHNSSSSSSSSWNSSMKVMSYNIWNFNPYGDNFMYSHRIDRLLQLIDKADPDIVGLQEVRLEEIRGGELGPNQMGHISSYLKHYQYVFQPAQVFDTSLKSGRSEEGVAILSKYPIIYHDYLLLFRNRSNTADSHQRICLHAVILVPSIGLVHVFNTHYSLSHEAREKASRQIIEFMQMYGGPAILMGDFNATPDEKGFKVLVEKDTGLVDAWAHLHPNHKGFTFSTLHAKLEKRIDYILLRKLPGVKVKEIKVLNDNARSNICSDHRALQAVISFTSCQ